MKPSACHSQMEMSMYLNAIPFKATANCAKISSGRRSRLSIPLTGLQFRMLSEQVSTILQAIIVPALLNISLPYQTALIIHKVLPTESTHFRITGIGILY